MTSRFMTTPSAKVDVRRKTSAYGQHHASISVEVCRCGDRPCWHAGPEAQRALCAATSSFLYDSPRCALASLAVAIVAPRLLRISAAWVTNSALVFASTPLEI